MGFLSGGAFVCGQASAYLLTFPRHRHLLFFWLLPPLSDFFKKVFLVHYGIILFVSGEIM